MHRRCSQALISGAVAFFHPPSLSWMTGAQFEQGVGMLMLAMGLSLSMDDFRRCAANPGPILLGFFCQYSVLPVLAYTLARVLHLSPAFSTGLILLGCCPGGQASNVATFVSRQCPCTRHCHSMPACLLPTSGLLAPLAGCSSSPVHRSRAG
jgi:predicted Na+-dependent transporter